LGDDDLGGAAAYLAGVMAQAEIPFDHVPSAQAPGDSFLTQSYSAYVLSDYPAARWNAEQIAHLLACVQRGSGLAMLGGWESFHGRLGEYHQSPLAEALPVVLAEADDRRNCAQPCLIDKQVDHPILAGLPWDNPPTIGGYNALRAKPEAQTLLAGVPFTVNKSGGTFRFIRRGEVRGEVPLLVVGSYGAGRTAALATDVAPHWVGGWVDWGDKRITQAIGSGFIEVGNCYARFFRNLVMWIAGEEVGEGEGTKGQRDKGTKVRKGGGKRTNKKGDKQTEAVKG
jgi:uncharacterized membrane protein